MIIDCGDNSCYFAQDKTGQRTNGGCRCFTNAGLNTRSSVQAGYELLPKYLKLKQIYDLLDRMIDTEHKKFKDNPNQLYDFQRIILAVWDYRKNDL